MAGSVCEKSIGDLDDDLLTRKLSVREYDWMAPGRSRGQYDSVHFLPARPCHPCNPYFGH